jgi:putative membrane protein
MTLLSNWRTLQAAAFALTLAVCGSTAFGGEAAASKPSSQDREFVVNAAHASWAEIAMGQLAQSSGTTENVRQFGQRMIQDHSSAAKELESIAGKLGLSAPKQPDPKYQGDIKALSKATGAEFDRLYAGYMVTSHETTLQLFQKQASKGDNAHLKQFAAKQVPVLEQHLSMARSLAKDRR